MDDLASELDPEHQASVVAMLSTFEAQVLVTSTERVPALEVIEARTFHVEHGQIRT